MLRPWIFMVLLIAVATLCVGLWIGSRKLEAGRVRLALDEAKKEMASNRYHLAWKRLSRLPSTGSANGEVEYQLGVCEVSRGNRDAALSAWEKVPPHSPFAGKAAVQRGMLTMTLGKFGLAEEILSKAVVNVPLNDRHTLYQALEMLYQLESRTNDVRSAIFNSWNSAEDPAAVLKQLYRLDTSPLPLVFTTSVVEKADSNDDRVLLARANLATRTGKFDEATKLLDQCVRLRPSDALVWLAELDLAQARGDLPAAWVALERLPSEALSALQTLQVRAWLAEQTGDPATQRMALEALAAHEPGDTTTLDRLAALANQSGDLNELARLRSRQAEMTAAKQNYKELLKGDSFGDPAELADLAATLGRTAEARGWSLIRDNRAGKQSSGIRPSLDVDATSSTPGQPPGQSLAERFADLRKPVDHLKLSLAAPRIIPQFIDQAEAAGLSFVHENGASAERQLPETMSGGVGLFDYDLDGHLDVYAVQGGRFPPSTIATCADRLYRNLGDGTFEDVTSRAGIDKLSGGYGNGVAIGDCDNDGDPDLFITRWNAYALYRNRGDGTFEDATTNAGLGGPRDWPTSAAWADLDNDGDLDLYVCHYLLFDDKHPPECIDTRTKNRQYCSPRQFTALADHVYRNDGGHFTDVTSTGGFVDPDGRGLGVLAAQLDEDDQIDVYVANDMSANYLFHNLGGFRFEEVAVAAGAGANSSGGYQSGMGIACGDIDHDGRPELAVTNYFGESTTLFHNDGRGLFSDRTSSFGIAIPSRHILGFGLAFLDANNDGNLDLLSANGHVSDLRPVFPWKMPIQLLLGQPGGRLDDLSAHSGKPFQPLHLGRGLAIGDVDNDGLVDALIVSENEALIMLANRTENAGHWLTIQLEGVKSNRDAVGARVEVRAGSRHLYAQRTAGGSYQSASDSRLHFGLGDESRIDAVEIRWPTGHVDRLTSLESDRGYVLREGSAEPKVIRSFSGKLKPMKALPKSPLR